MRLVLASQSPRRRELLGLLGLDPEVRPAHADETLHPGEPAEAYVRRVAREKAAAVAGELVLGADTAVVLAGQILGKPADEADARRILSELSGSEHHVLTGLALLEPDSGRRWIAHDDTRIRMRAMSPAEIDAYVASGEAMGKAGAYAIQETGDRYVESIDGSLTNVVGLPMELLERMLKAAGHDPREFRE